MNPNDEENEIPPEYDAELREHVYDGIQEYDKKLPNWWLLTFYGAIVFSIGYWFYYHMTEIGFTPEEKLAMVQARAAAYAAAASGDGFAPEILLAMSQDDAVLERAKAAYGVNCSACHGADLEGGIGPNLKDGEWVHGGQPTQILASIQVGIAAKGMPGWGSVLGQTASAELTALLLHLNPALDLETGPASMGNPSDSETL